MSKFESKLAEVLTDIHKTRRRKSYEKYGVKIRAMCIHNAFHKILFLTIKLLRILRKQELIILADKRKKTDKPVIYAVTHIGGFDAEVGFETVNSPAWIFVGDPRELYYNFDGLMLFLNGVICIETNDKEDRAIGKNKAIELLKRGGNLLIYPEGAWNISENLLVEPLFAGATDMAVITGADIIPVALEVYGNTYYANVGENVPSTEFEGLSREEATILLRDIMATLKWEILESQEICSRNELPDNYGEIFLNKILTSKKTSYSVEDIVSTRRRK